MILRRLILLAVIAAGLVVSSGVIVIGLIYALHTLLEPHLGPAGATGVMVGLVAVIFGAASAALFAVSKPKKAAVAVAPQPSPIDSLVATLSDTVRARPAVVLLAAVGAGVLAIRNPVYLATAVRAFTAPKPTAD